jgi:hypothetical protein
MFDGYYWIKERSTDKLMIAEYKNFRYYLTDGTYLNIEQVETLKGIVYFDHQQIRKNDKIKAGSEWHDHRGTELAVIAVIADQYLYHKVICRTSDSLYSIPVDTWLAEMAAGRFEEIT